MVTGELLANPAVIPALNTLHGRGWRLDHSPWVICGDQQRTADAVTPNAYGGDGGGGTSHGHVWDPECRYHYANGVMRSGMVVVAFQLRDIKEGWGGFGVIPGVCCSPFALMAALHPRLFPFY